MGDTRNSELNNAPAYTAFVPTAEKDKSEQVLLGAMLREPFNLSQHIGQMNRVALSMASNGIGSDLVEIMNQFAQYGKYSSFTVSQKTGNNVAAYASRDTEVDLAWAVENWWYQYTCWAESCAMAAGMAEAVNGVAAMRQATEKERERLGLNTNEVSTDYCEDFATWAADKIEGNEKAYLTTPSTDALRSIVRAFEPGELWVFAGRPGMGKTQHALNLLSHFYDQGLKGLFVSLEMSPEQLLRRLLGIRHGINAQGDWSAIDKKTLWDATNDVRAIYDRVKIVNNCNTIADVEAQAMAAHYRGELQFLMIDYLQLVSASSGKSYDENTEMTRVSGALMRMARTLKIPVIALSQLSRAVETRGGSKRPNLSDLRSSGAIEQNAHGVVFHYRAEYYQILEDESGCSLKGVGEAIVAKNRNGATDTAKMQWNPIRGYTDIQGDQPFSTQFPTPAPFTVPTARGLKDHDIPF